MKICLFDHHPTSYPVDKYGGIERINELLFRKLVDLNHDVTLVINNNKEFNYKNGKIIQLPFEEIENLRFGRAAISKYIKEVDIFHSHTSGNNAGFDFDGFKGQWTATVHGSYEDSGAPYLAFVSEFQRKFHQEKFDIDNKCKKSFVCYNGIDENLYEYRPNGNHDKIVWIGNICFGKGTVLALQIAKNLNKEMLIAGPIGDLRYFKTEIEPLLDSQRVYLGEIPQLEINDFFSEAAVYLHTSLTQEPFGVSQIQAGACGVPTFCFDSGAAYETNFCTSFCVPNMDEMASLIEEQTYKDFSGEEIRNATIAKFGSVPMVDGYLDFWKDALNG